MATQPFDTMTTLESTTHQPFSPEVIPSSERTMGIDAGIGRSNATRYPVETGGSFRSRPQKYGVMGFVTVRDEGDEHYDWHLRPGGGRPFDVLTVLVDFLDDGGYTVDSNDVLAALEERIDTDWGDTNLSPYINSDSDVSDLRSAGAVNKVKAVGNESRRPLQLDAPMIRTLAPGYYEHAASDEVRRMMRYLGSADLDGEDLDPRAARLYVILAANADVVDESEYPEVKVTFRQFGRPDDADDDWLADYPFDSPPLLLGAFEKQYAEFAILIDIDYRNLEVAKPEALERAYNDELMDYLAAALYDDYATFTTEASHATREQHVRQQADASGASDPAVSAQMPFFDSIVTLDRNSNHVQLAALYQREKN
ncbi:hypothetical protein C496_23371 [Natronorubrum tibetense GA33]|uniref:Uncharacterized protein n=2 Tax=Natronorubrum tibetense TaxID=63128 RepID=L9VET3_9EURY|nr:hypothetical protein C496_23371 [Natronorubrum tibetense GA33]